MAASDTASVLITWNQVAAFRLKRHHLSGITTKDQLLTIAADINGAQAQLQSAAQISLWTRIQDLTLEDLTRALKERKLVKAACMRRTLFLVPADQLAIFVRGSAQRAQKEYRWAQGKGLSDQVLRTAIDAALEVLDQPLTRPEIAERVCRKMGVPVKMISGGGWGNRIPIPGVPVGELTYPVVDLLHLAGSRGVVCYGPDQENGPTFVRADAWISDWQDVPVVEAEGRLLRSYLHSFGPATPEDFSVWTGMSLTGAREVWNRELFQMVSVHVEGRKAFILAQDLEDLLRTNPDEHTIRLLPHFDTFLLGHRERDHLIDEKLRSRVYRPQGWIAPVVLVDGQILALWGCHWRQKQLNVKVDPLKPLNAGILEQISNEAQKLGKFLAAENTHLIIER